MISFFVDLPSIELRSGYWYFKLVVVFKVLQLLVEKLA